MTFKGFCLSPTLSSDHFWPSLLNMSKSYMYPSLYSCTLKKIVQLKSGQEKFITTNMRSE